MCPPKGGRYETQGAGKMPALRTACPAESSGTQNARYEGKSVAARAIAGLAASSQGCSPGMAWIRLRSPQVPCPYGEMGGRARQASRKRGGSQLPHSTEETARTKAPTYKARWPLRRLKRPTLRGKARRMGHPAQSPLRVRSSVRSGGRRESGSHGQSGRCDHRSRHTGIPEAAELDAYTSRAAPVEWPVAFRA